MSRSPSYERNSLSLTGVMIGAGILALSGQVAELACEWFVLAPLVAGASPVSAPIPTSSCPTPIPRRAAWSDMRVLWVSLVGLVVIFAGEWLFLQFRTEDETP